MFLLEGVPDEAYNTCFFAVGRKDIGMSDLELKFTTGSARAAKEAIAAVFNTLGWTFAWEYETNKEVHIPRHFQKYLPSDCKKRVHTLSSGYSHTHDGSVDFIGLYIWMQQGDMSHVFGRLGNIYSGWEPLSAELITSKSVPRGKRGQNRAKFRPQVSQIRFRLTTEKTDMFGNPMLPKIQAEIVSDKRNFLVYPMHSRRVLKIHRGFEEEVILEEGSYLHHLIDDLPFQFHEGDFAEMHERWEIDRWQDCRQCPRADSCKHHLCQKHFNRVAESS